MRGGGRRGEPRARTVLGPSAPKGGASGTCSCGAESPAELALGSPRRLRQQPPLRRGPLRLALGSSATPWNRVARLLRLKAITASRSAAPDRSLERFGGDGGSLATTAPRSAGVPRGGVRRSGGVTGGRPRVCSASLTRGPSYPASRGRRRPFGTRTVRAGAPPVTRRDPIAASPRARRPRCYDRGLRGGDLVSTKWLSCTSCVPRFQEASLNTWESITANNSYSLAA